MKSSDGALGHTQHRFFRRAAVFACAVFGSLAYAAGQGDSAGAPSASEAASRTSVLGTTVAPAGERIAFASDPESDYDIYAINPDGTEETKLLGDPAVDFDPAWSPDGTRIAFARYDRVHGIYVMNADGSGLTGPLDGGFFADAQPAWSPDGMRIAFMSHRYGSEDIFVMHADGTGLTRVTHNDAREIQPAWSPDGRYLVFARAESDFELYAIRADGSGETRLTNNETADLYPSWSPDGTQIVFSSKRDSTREAIFSEIYVMDSDGSDQTRITHNYASAVQPVWSPDGTRIAFARNKPPEDQSRSLYVMNADGSDQIPVSKTPGRDEVPDWGPRQAYLSVAKTGTGRGDIASAPPGIACGSDCSELYPHDAYVVLEAHPASESVFSGWKGACSGFALTCTVRMNGMKSVAAGFAVAPPGCTIVGTPSNDLLVGTARADVICALGGDDLVRGGRGNDIIRLGAGDDVAYGHRGRDRLAGARGGDRLIGGRGPDVLLGGRGNDVLRARDFLRDVVDGGRRADRARVDYIDRLRSIEKPF